MKTFLALLMHLLVLLRNASIFAAFRNPFKVSYNLKYIVLGVLLILQSCHHQAPLKISNILYFKGFDYLKMEGVEPTQDTVNQAFVRIEKLFLDDTILVGYDILIHENQKEAQVKRYWKNDSLWEGIYMKINSYELNAEVDCYKQFIDTKNKIFVEYKLKGYFEPPKIRFYHLFIRDSVLFQQYTLFPDTILSNIALNYENAASIKAFAALSVSNCYKLEKTKLHVHRTFLDKSDKNQKIDSTITHESFKQPANGTWLIRWNGNPGAIDGLF